MVNGCFERETEFDTGLLDYWIDYQEIFCTLHIYTNIAQAYGHYPYPVYSICICSTESIYMRCLVFYLIFLC